MYQLLGITLYIYEWQIWKVLDGSSHDLLDPGICLEELKNTMKNCGQESSWSGQDFNQASPK